MTCVESHFLSQVDWEKVAMAGSLAKLMPGFMRGSGGALAKGLGSKMMAPRQVMGPRSLRPPPPVRMQEMLDAPGFQEVIQSSQAGFPKLPGLSITNPDVQYAILRPHHLAVPGNRFMNSGTMKHVQQQLATARAPLARSIRGYRNLQRQGILI